MPITFDKKNMIFNLKSKNSSYIFCIYKNLYPIHLHYGARIDSDFDAEPFTGERSDRYLASFSSENPSPANFSGEVAPLEYPAFGSPDLKTPAFCAKYADGTICTDLVYESHRIYKGKPRLSGLPAFYTESDDEAETLELTLADKHRGVSVILKYTVYSDFDAICRSSEVVNNSKSNIELTNVMSTYVCFDNKDYDFIHFYGSWAHERQLQRFPLFNGIQAVDSKRGLSSHNHNPFVMLAGKSATETTGEAYGFGLVYSSNFYAGVEVDVMDKARLSMGINSFGFSWMLGEGERFQTPEAVMVYSSCGMGEMSRTYHKLIKKRLVRGKYRDISRPVLINNWEATYFDFNEDDILNIAKKAKEVGVELMVLDDGWFGKRNDDNCSLGDWYANTEKLPSGIEGLAEKINNIGMKFGLWFEPEMVSPDSDLYRAHPDWCIHIEGKEGCLGRRQLTLDLSRKDVCDYIKGFLTDILMKAKISYVKWDMNRSMSDFGSSLLPASKQGELCHRYILGLYDILEEITSKFPDVLFEGCSGGGGRFDLGMFYYYPQFWCSDDTDAVERLYIQHGTSYLYPFCTMGAHVSAVPNHQVGRTTPIKMRGLCALPGAFGYELDLNKLPDEELEIVKEQILLYKELSQFFHDANLYRISSPFDSNNTVWEFVSDSKDEAVVLIFASRAVPTPPFYTFKLGGLDKSAEYIDTFTGRRYFGDVLESIGINRKITEDYYSEIIHLKKV